MVKDKHLEELSEIDDSIDTLNWWFIVNTIATIITGIAGLIISIILLWRK